MKVALDQIKASPTPLRYREAADVLNAKLHQGHGAHDDYGFPAGLEADLEHYRAGLDVVFDGRLRGEAEGRCARCLEAYRLPVEQPLRVVLAPRASAGDGEEDDLGLGLRRRGDRRDGAGRRARDPRSCRRCRSAPKTVAGSARSVERIATSIPARDADAEPPRQASRRLAGLKLPDGEGR
jgi:hypothetical protein